MDEREKDSRTGPQDAREDSGPGVTGSRQTGAADPSRNAGYREDPKKKKKRRGLFGRSGGEPSGEEEDIYYGLQLKPLEEYQKQYRQTIMNSGPEEKKQDSVFSYLFQDEDESVDREIAERFARLHREREERIKKIVNDTGADHDIFSFYPPQGAVGEAEPTPRKEEEAKDISSGRALDDTPEQAPPEDPVGEGNQTAVPAAPTIKIPAVGSMNGQPLSATEPIQPAAPTAPTLPTGPASPEPVVSPPEFPASAAPVEMPPVSEPSEPRRIIDDSPKRAPRTEPPNRRGDPIRTYRAAERPVHILEWDILRSALECEAKAYPKPRWFQKTEPASMGAQPQTIEFPTAAARARSTRSVPLVEGEEPRSIPFPVRKAPDPEEEPEGAKGDPAKEKQGFHLTGSEEPENDPQEELEPEPEELEDYQSPTDAASVAHDLGRHLRQLTLRFIVTGLCSVFLFVFGLLGEGGELLPPALRVPLPIQTMLILNLIFLLTACAFSFVPIASGLKSLVCMRADSDSGVALAALAAVIQSGVMVFLPDPVASGTLHVYASLVSAALFLNTAGKLSMIRRIRRNFRFVASPVQKCAVQLFDDHNTALQMTEDCIVGTPVVAYQTRANFLKQFLGLSYEQDPSDQSAAVAAPIGCILSLLLFIATFLLSKDAPTALAAFTAACCACTPFLSTICVNFPCSRVSRLAARCGGMVVGYAAMDRFSAVNAVLLDAKDLFPRGTVVLSGIKSFGEQRVDQAITDATALIGEVGGPLADLFDQIIKSKREILPKVSNVVYEDEMGVTGRVEGRTILIGNRDLLETFGVEPPSHDYEDKYRLGGRELVYLASDGELVAMFLITYESDRRRASELRRMENIGVSILVRTADPNITEDFLADCFGLNPNSIRVLPERLGQVYQDLVKEPADRAEALLATKGRPTAMMRLLAACIRQRGNITLGVVMQNVAIALGFTLVAFLSCWSGLKQLTTLALLLYELFWVVVICIFPRLRRP